MDQSKKYTLNKADFQSISWIILFGAISVAITKALELLPMVDFGDNSELIVAVLTIVLKGVQRFVTGR